MSSMPAFKKVSKLPHTYARVTLGHFLYEELRDNITGYGWHEDSPLDLTAFGPGEYRVTLMDGTQIYAEVVAGLCKVMDKESWEHHYQTLKASELSQRQIDALRYCSREGMATKEQKMTLYYYDHSLDLRRIKRNGLTMRLRYRDKT